MTLTCPNVATSPPWKPTLADGQPRLSVLFPRATCRPCEDRSKCPGNVDGKGRHILLLPQPLQEIQNRVRREQKTQAWQGRYAMRAGCEATVSETVHAHGRRNCRYRGTAKTHVQHVLTAAGTNIVRLSQHDPSDVTADRRESPATRFHQLCQNLSDGTRTRHSGRSPTASGTPVRAVFADPHHQDALDRGPLVGEEGGLFAKPVSLVTGGGLPGLDLPQ
ncbi:transposase [Kitasatospora sp. NPDC059747]|uniref:transposase n=1 Tax=Kitasatospora sp. NPDC059747 TaxID=3346930 RepID=UPI0036687C1E